MYSKWFLLCSMTFTSAALGACEDEIVEVDIVRDGAVTRDAATDRDVTEGSAADASATPDVTGDAVTGDAAGPDVAADRATNDAPIADVVTERAAGDGSIRDVTVDRPSGDVATPEGSTTANPANPDAAEASIREGGSDARPE